MYFSGCYSNAISLILQMSKKKKKIQREIAYLLIENNFSSSAILNVNLKLVKYTKIQNVNIYKKNMFLYKKIFIY